MSLIRVWSKASMSLKSMSLKYEPSSEPQVVPYVVTKKTVFKWQEGFWLSMK